MRDKWGYHPNKHNITSGSIQATLAQHQNKVEQIELTRTSCHIIHDMSHSYINIHNDLLEI